jgi:hypothetical protein
MTTPQDPGVDERAHFPFLHGLRGEVAELLRFTTDEKIAAFDAGARFLGTERGRAVLDEIARELIQGGYPERSARLDPAMLPAFLARDNLASIVDNPAALPGGRALLDGAFVEIAPGVTMSSFPAGPVLVIGSGNSFMPAVVATIEALLASCPVVLRGSRINQPVLERVFAALREAGDPTLAALVARVHLFFLDHRVPEEASRLHWLLRHGPFAAGNFWGGRVAIDELTAELGRNPAHPVAIPMEPLTGVAVITQRYLDEAEGGSEAAATSLAAAVLAMGQQLCSSPTEAYFVGDPAAAEAFARQLAGALEAAGGSGDRDPGEGSAMLLDRVRNRCEELGSTVLLPASEDASWTVVVSAGRSAFTRLPAACALPIHSRSGFLEIISLPDLAGVADHIAALPSAPCHGEIARVQTILRLARLDELRQIMRSLRGRGGVYRAVPPEYVVFRHALEPLDGQHLIALLTRQMVLL